jgi:GxxExxY protein
MTLIGRIWADMLMNLKHGELTDQIINAFYLVYNSLGYGFLEKVYRNALAFELRKRQLSVTTEEKIEVYYEGVIVGEYFADVVVERKVVLELKTAEAISEAHVAQLTNYLQATVYEVGLVLNFGPKPTFERRFYSNDSKKHLKKIRDNPPDPRHPRPKRLNL